MKSIKHIINGHSFQFNVILLLVVALVCIQGVQSKCFAYDVSLTWGAVDDPTVVGYKVYYQQDSSAQPFNGTGAVQGASPIDNHALTSVTVSGLDPNKPYYFAVTSYDAEGTESLYSKVLAVPEGFPPVVSITAPVNNATVNGTVSIAAGATDNVGVASVEFYVNGQLLTTQTTAPYLASWNTSALAGGVYTISAIAIDAAGNVGHSTNVSVTVVNDTTAPVVSLTAPGNSATVSGTVAITASASDNVGVSKVEFYQNGTLLYAGNVAPFSYNWNTMSLANGSYTLLAKAYDNAGNIGQSANVAVTVLNDAIAPAVTAFTLPTTASSTTVAVSSFTATDNTKVTGYLITESAIAPAANAAGWSSSAPASFTFAGDGIRTAYAWAKDAANNISASLSATVGIVLPDTTAPTVSISAPVSNATVSGTVSVNATANDNTGVSKVDFYVNGTLQSSSSTSPYSFNWDTNIVKDGSYTLSARAYDTTGNVKQSTALTIYVNNAATLPSGTYSDLFGNAAGSDYPDTIEDTFININNGVNSASQVLNTYTWPVNTPANAILMKWNLSALPANAKIQSATLYLYLNGSGGDDLYEIPVSEVINKQPVIAASTGYTYDGTNPWTPSSVPYNGIPLAQSDISPAVDAPLIDKTFGYKKWNVTNMVQDWVVTPGNNRGLMLNSSNKASSDSNRVFASSNAVDANVRPRLVVVYTVPDTTLPTVSIDSPSNNTSVSGTVSVTAGASDNIAVTRVEFYVNGALRSSSTSAPYSFDWDTASLTSGAYALTAKAYDAAGNVGQSTKVTTTVLNDTTPPTVSAFTAPASAYTLSVPISSFSVTDNVGVTGYLVTESAIVPSAGLVGWSASAPSAYTFTTTGTKTLYAWARDAAGNVSAAKTTTIVISIPKTVSQDVMILDSSTTFPTIQDAYNTVPENGTIAAKDVTLSEDLNFNRAVNVNLDGGMDASFQSTTGTTAVSGVIKISKGKVVVSKIIIR